MNPLPATDAFHQSPVVDSDCNEDLSLTSQRCFPFLCLPLEIQLLIYRHALTGPYPIPLKTHPESQTQETSLSAPSLTLQSNSPLSVVEQHSGVGYDGLTLESEKEETESHPANPTREASTVSVQRYAVISSNHLEVASSLLLAFVLNLSISNVYCLPALTGSCYEISD